MVYSLRESKGIGNVVFAGVVVVLVVAIALVGFIGYRVVSLQSDFDNLQSDYNHLRSANSQLQSNYSNIQSQLSSLQSSFNQLNNSYQQLLATRNVNVTNPWFKILDSTDEWIQNFTYPPHSSTYYSEPTKGYREVTLYVFVTSPVTPDCQVSVTTNFWIEGSNHAPNMDSFIVNRFLNVTVWKTYEVIGSTFGFLVTNPTNMEISGSIAIYVTT